MEKQFAANFGRVRHLFPLTTRLALVPFTVMAKRSSATSSADSGGLSLSSPALRILLLIGPDLFAREEALRTVRTACEKQHGEVDVRFLPGEATTTADVLDECRSMGLIARHKIIIIDDAEKLVNADTRPHFERYAAAPSPATTLVLRSTKLIPGKLGDAVLLVGAVVDCKPPDHATAVAWVLNTCAARHNIGIDPSAAELLVARIGPVLAQLDTELEKLATAALDAPVISAALVAEFTGKTVEEGAYALQGKITSLPPSKRLEEIRHLIDVNRESPVFILWVLTDLARKLHGASRGLGANVNPFQLKSKLKIWGPSSDAMLEVAKTTQPARLLHIFRACVAADKRTKSGFGDAEVNAQICAARFPRLGVPARR